MAMLAEPRRKQKWSVDPRNSTWSKDESKFGQKMLEKMGWSKGKGLGAQEQGSTEHIRVHVKNNTLGLGASNNHEDNWIAHQDDFNQLLAELNDHHGAGSAASSDNENKKSFSLEEKSKSSKKRVHYMKFAKGKDLSCRSNTDLACIFGKREKVKKEETNSEPDEYEDKSPSPTTEVETLNTVTSSLSVNEYFAKRMAELKRSYAKCRERVTESVDQCPDHSVENSENPKKKSKKKKRRKNDNDYSPEEPEVVENLQDEDNVDTTESRVKRRKSKTKKENKVLSAENSEDREEEEEEEQNETLKKKKKNKRKKDRRDERTEDFTSAPDEDIITEQPKKKKKRRKQDKSED